MQRICKVCGSGNVSLVWGSRRGIVRYCSFRCYAKGNVYYTLGLAVFLCVAAIVLIIAYFVTPGPISEALIFGITAGVVGIYCSILSTLGFYFKRKADD